jgi:hypothetical protein
LPSITWRFQPRKQPMQCHRRSQRRS